MAAQTKKLHLSKKTSSPTPTVTPQGAAGLVAYSYKLVGINSDAQAAAAGTAGSTATGNAVLDGTNFNRITWTDSAGADHFDVYRTVGGATQGKIGTVLAGIHTFDDTGLVADGTTAPAVDATGVGKATATAQFQAASLQCSGAGAAFTGTVQAQGSNDGVEWDDFGAAFTAAGFLDVTRRYSLMRGKMTAYTSGDPQLWINGVGGGAE